MSGYPYIVSRYLSDETIELSRVKIGYFTGNDLENQVHQSYSRSLTPVVIYDYIPSHNPRWAETTIHIALNKWRINPQNEIFDLSSQEARDSFVKVKNIIIQLTKESGLPTPMIRRIDYNYWRIAKQAAKVGRKWHKIYIETQLLEDKKQKKKDADDIKQMEQERKIKEKNEKKKEAINKIKIQITDDTVQQFIESYCVINEKDNVRADTFKKKLKKIFKINTNMDDLKNIMSKKGFEYGRPYIEGKQIRCYTGLRFK